MTTFTPRSTLLLICLLLAGGTKGALAQRVGLLDTRTAAYVQFSSPSYTASNGEQDVVITVIRTGEFREPLSVDYSTADGTAHAPQDYTATTGTLTFPAGVGIATFHVSVRTDTQAPGTRTVRLNLFNPGFNGLIIDGEATLTILDATVAIRADVRLTVRASGSGAVLISWPASIVPCVLEKSIESSGGGWDEVAQAPQIAEGACTILEPASAARYFYRLKAR